MFEEFRSDFATIMTAVVQVAGIDRVYTHLSHAGRGLKHKPTEKLGPHKTRAVRGGEYVPADARNARTIATNEALAEIERIDERAVRQGRRMERLTALKSAVARVLSPAVHRPPHEDVRHVRAPSRAAGYTPAPMSTALLAAAGRVTELAGHSAAGGLYGQDTTLADAPSPQDASLLDDFVRWPSATDIVAPASIPQRTPSTIAMEWSQASQAPRLAKRATQVARDEIVRGVSAQPLVKVPVAVCPRALSEAVHVDIAASGIRTPSAPRPIVAAAKRARQLAPALSAARSGRSARPLSSAGLENLRASQVRFRTPMNVAPPSTPWAESRRPLAVQSVDAAVIAGLKGTTSIIDVERVFPTKTRALRSMRQVEQVLPELAHSPDRSTARLKRTQRRIDEIEREIKALADAAEAQAAEEHRHREHDRFIRFLALVALNPDWIEDGERGLEVASHAPPQLHDAYASWQNDHERPALVADVCQATFDGIHRLPPPLAIEVARTAEAKSRRLPAPVPLQNWHGRVAPAVELALALVADNPGWIVAPGSTPQVSADASPALTAIVERYRQDRTLLPLLAAAKRHGEGIANAGLRRARGSLHVLAPGREQLSPAMVDHLAQVRCRLDWIVQDKHLGFGLSSEASPLFHQQWGAWSEPKLARQFILEMITPAAKPRALTPAMRSQIMDRVRSLAGPAAAGRMLESPAEDEPSR